MPDADRPANCPPCPECPDCDTEGCDCEQPSSPLLAALALVQQLLLDSPRNAGEAVWRAFAVLGLSGLLVCGWIAWRYPAVVQGWLERAPSPLVADRLHNSKAAQRQVIDAIATYIRVARPDRFALVGMRTATTAEIAWSTTDVQDWPTNLQGVLSSDLIQAVGQLTFGECWSGQLTGQGPPWHACPISDGDRLTGFVISQWSSDVSPLDQRGLDHLAQRIQGLLY